MVFCEVGKGTVHRCVGAVAQKKRQVRTPRRASSATPFLLDAGSHRRLRARAFTPEDMTRDPRHPDVAARCATSSIQQSVPRQLVRPYTRGLRDGTVIEGGQPESARRRPRGRGSARSRRVQGQQQPGAGRQKHLTRAGARAAKGLFDGPVDLSPLQGLSSLRARIAPTAVVWQGLPGHVGTVGSQSGRTCRESSGGPSRGQLPSAPRDRAAPRTQVLLRWPPRAAGRERWP